MLSCCVPFGSNNGSSHQIHPGCPPFSEAINTMFLFFLAMRQAQAGMFFCIITSLLDLAEILCPKSQVTGLLCSLWAQLLSPLTSICSVPQLSAVGFECYSHSKLITISWVMYWPS